MEVVKDGEDTAVNVMWPGYHTIPALGMVNKQAYGGKLEWYPDPKSSMLMMSEELMPIWDEEYVKRHAFEALCIHQEDIKTAIKWARRNLPVQGGGLYGKNFTLIFHGVFDPEWDFAPFRPVYELQYDIHLVPDTQRLLDIQLRAYIRTSEEQSFLNCLGRLLRDAKRRAERPGGTKGPADMQQGFLRICRVLKQQAERETAH